MFQAKQAQLRKEEEEKREYEEYLKIKEAFSVEEEGEEDIAPDLSVIIYSLSHNNSIQALYKQI